MLSRYVFAELPALRRSARAKARAQRHDLSEFRVRPSDATKLKAFCRRCGAALVINLDPDDGFLSSLSGPALETICKGP